MGASTWSESHYLEAVTRKKTTRGTSFTHDDDVRAGKVRNGAHPDLDPSSMKNGMRESRDSDIHPESNSVIVFLDVTGSMSSVVRQVHASLPNLMGLLTRKNYLSHPQILFAAIGDAYSDRTPLQVGQFESGVEMEGDISKFYLEGGGGGGGTESYELGAYFAAYHTSIDCFEKRNKKGYCIFIGDERPYSDVNKAQVKKLLNANIQSDMSTEHVFSKLKEKYEAIVIMPTGSVHGSRFKPVWQNLVGKQNVLELQDASAAAELIATQIGVFEKDIDFENIERDLRDIGSSRALIKTVKESVKIKDKNNDGIVNTDAFDNLSAKSNVKRL